ncbi:hypothetical protein AXX17_AT1G32170 [Arabidopsis thaliana]|uniref:F-box associated beta-propeller type 1 domain-containing protein n=1 Tax=Arabidopsis thaliana TaxID=3702 RepID=A0A178WMQ9_ARATH|nr:hypothetical protein AXX17_AT1G32170 [Arabidopsis thaliana]
MSHMHGLEPIFTVFNYVPATVSPLCSTISCIGMDFNNKPSLNFQVFKPLSSSDLLEHNMFHCDGLLLMVMGTKILVSNPLLKEARWIKCGYSFEFDHSIDAYGLGYISNESPSGCNDYKMVRFRCPNNLSVEIYDFKSDCWKVVVVDKTFHGFFRLPLSSVCIRGTPYWIGYNIYGTVSIQSFDFSKERFETLFESLHHSSIGIQWKDSLSLGIFRGDHLSLLREPHLAAQLPKFPIYPSHFIENNECPKVECYSSMESSIGGPGCYYICPKLTSGSRLFEVIKRKKNKRAPIHCYELNGYLLSCVIMVFTFELYKHSGITS